MRSGPSPFSIGGPTLAGAHTMSLFGERQTRGRAASESSVPFQDQASVEIPIEPFYEERRSAKSGRSQCVSLYNLWSSCDDDELVPAIFQVPGIRRDYTSTFRDLRRQFRQRNFELAGPRIQWLASIAADRDAPALARFVDIGFEATRSPPSKACAWCNARLGSAKRRSGIGTVGKTNVDTDGTRPPRLCHVCSKWHCVVCCNQTADLTVFVGEQDQLRRKSGLSSWATRQTAASLNRCKNLESCNSCRRLVDIAQWRRESPPSGLAPSSQKLFAVHAKLAERMTKLSVALAQLEGLTRLVELYNTEGVELKSEQEQPEEDDCSPYRDEVLRRARSASTRASDLRQEYADALAVSRTHASQAQLALEATLRSLCEAAGASVAPGPPRDEKLREALHQHGRRLLEDLKPRLSTALMRGVPKREHRSSLAFVPGESTQIFPSCRRRPSWV
eukprot:TRINITY_DN63161_c0_g1_i1.p1 TRINITY_DN63161_c0_g1~~TRINITY_DN63161_c0_g1_i1.p1  ORF type:complete len:448 (+),score=47.83 TRINITY_DN63161_c0_g1_i1:192-1535(+)